jgi:integrase
VRNVAWVDAVQRADEPVDEHDAASDPPLADPAARALIPAAETADKGAGDAWSSAPGERTWRHELPRWLATLDSGRTRHEYEKAVGYFFATPRVPQELSALTLDLLLAYRGSLALRADQRARRASQGSPVPDGAPPLPPEDNPNLLSGHTSAWETADDPRATRAASVTSPLAPATVNVRLTALRQFLAHCSLWERVPQLPPERMRAALRRLKVERRRPYQVLEEQEWADFLRAAAGRPDLWSAPADEAAEERVPVPVATSAVDDTAVATDVGSPRSPRAGPWGTTRAARARRRGEEGERHDREAPAAAAPTTSPEPAVDERGRGEPAALERSRAGLTGRHTAQRDHALLSLALATGLRAIELCSLDVDNLTREWHQGRAEWWLVLRDAQTKGQRGGRTLPLALDLVQALLEYIESTGRSWEHAADHATPLFLSLRATRDSATRDSATRKDDAPSMRAHRLTPEQVRRIVDRVETQWLASRGAAVSLQHDGDGDARAISPHALRHSTAIALLAGNERAGRPPASVEHVRGWLGHFDIRTTQGYLAHLDARRHRRPFTLAPASGSAPAGVDEEGQADQLPPSDQ